MEETGTAVSAVVWVDMAIEVGGQRIVSCWLR